MAEISSVKFTLNGTTYSLSLDTSTGKYKATINAPNLSSFSQPENKYAGQITVQDMAGNTTTVNSTHATLGNSLKLRVMEKVKPVITMQYPTANATIVNNKPAIAVKITDNDSGVKQSSVVFKVDGSTVAPTFSSTSGGFIATYTPPNALADGSHTVTVNAEDNDGNAATQLSSSFKIDTVPPSLNITSPVDNFITNSTTITLTGNTNDSTSSPCTVTAKVNSGSPVSVTVNADGSFSKDLQLAEGNNTVTIVSTDGAGKFTTVVRNVKVDTVAPTISSVTITPNPVDTGATYIITVEVTD